MNNKLDDSINTINEAIYKVSEGLFKLSKASSDAKDTQVIAINEELRNLRALNDNYRNQLRELNNIKAHNRHLKSRINELGKEKEKLEKENEKLEETIFSLCDWPMEKKIWFDIETNIARSPKFPKDRSYLYQGSQYYKALEEIYNIKGAENGRFSSIHDSFMIDMDDD